MTKGMTKKQAIELVCGKGKKAIHLAKALGIHPSAITHWPDEKIPVRRELEIREIVRLRKKKAAKKKTKKESI